ERTGDIMSKQKEQDLEIGMKRAIAGMQEFKAEMEEKRYNRYWKNIKIPFALNEGLSGYTKDELVDIRTYLDIKNGSNLKKAELVSIIEETILVNLEYICQIWDQERFKLLMKIAGNDGFIDTSDKDIQDDEIRYFRKT